MKYDNYASFVRAQTKTDSTSFPDAKLTLFSNIAKDDLAEEIVQEDEGYFDMVLTTSLVADQRQYSFPVDMLRSMKMIEAKLDGTNWKRVWEFDLNSYRLRQSSSIKQYNDLDISGSFSGATTDEATIIKTFSDDYPSFDIDGNTINLYTGSAISSVTNGLKLHATLYPTDFADADWSSTTDMSVIKNSTATALPRPSHEVLARKTIILFKEANQIPLDAFDLNIENALAKMKKKLNKVNEDRVILPSVPRNTGYEY